MFESIKRWFIGLFSTKTKSRKVNVLIREWSDGDRTVPLQEYLGLNDGEYDLLVRIGIASCIPSDEIVEAVNRLRSETGYALDPLTTDVRLNHAASRNGFCNDFITITRGDEKINWLGHQMKEALATHGMQPDGLKVFRVFDVDSCDDLVDLLVLKPEFMDTLSNPQFEEIGVRSIQTLDGRSITTVLLTTRNEIKGLHRPRWCDRTNPIQSLQTWKPL